MDISSISGTAVMMQAAQTQEKLSISMVKMAAQQQNLMANMLAQSAQQASQLASKSNNDFNFSIYA